MIDQLTAIDTDLFLTLNGIHNTYWDYFMSAFSGKLIWIPMYVSIAYLLFKNLDWKEALLFAIAIGVAAGLSDMTCAKAIRPFAERLRPSNPDNEISILVHIVDGYRGGAFGFPSCHAANSFALAISTDIPPAFPFIVHTAMGYCQFIFTHLFRSTLPRRPALWCNSRYTVGHNNNGGGKAIVQKSPILRNRQAKIRQHSRRSVSISNHDSGHSHILGDNDICPLILRNCYTAAT